MTETTDSENRKNGSSFALKRVGASNVISPGESLTHQNKDKLDAVLDELISKNRTRIVLDFKSVVYLDSEALELLVKAHNALKNRGGVLKIVGLSPVCRDIFLATRLSNVLNIHEDLAEALKN